MENTNEPDATVVDDSVDSGQSLVEQNPWMAQYKGDLQENEYLASLGGHTGVAEALIEARGKLESAIVRPSTEASEEEWAEYYKALGRPDDPDGYELSVPDDFPEGLEFDEELATAFKQKAFERGVPKEIAQDLFSWYAKHAAGKEVARAEARKAETEKALEDLKKEWGDNYEANSRLTARAREAFIGEENFELLNVEGPDGKRLGDNPVFLKTFYRIGKAMTDDGVINGVKSTPEAEDAALRRMYPNSPEMFE